MGHTYVLGKVSQAIGSAEETPTTIVVVGCADEQTSSEGLPSRQANSGGGVQDSSVLFPTHLPVLLRESVGGGE